ncbi:hypothetical protein ZOSMA_248G00440 [Zostera marina]|uniref:Aminotransferase-like plant mobile domain-containing protein n=1 Tax=Zostera marina TaxID=29655 RepID=A0A0K9PGV4_ZOSMR|nr:hypothetical protein ZOSMA_248G00440 [Zostera marina]
MGDPQTIRHSRSPKNPSTDNPIIGSSVIHKSDENLEVSSLFKNQPDQGPFSNEKIDILSSSILQTNLEYIKKAAKNVIQSKVAPTAVVAPRQFVNDVELFDLSFVNENATIKCSEDHTISENVEDVDCEIVKFIPCSNTPSTIPKSVVLRTLRSGKVLISSDRSIGNSRSVASCSTTKNFVGRKIVAHKARIVRSPTTSSIVCVERGHDMDSPRDDNMIVDDLPDDMPLSAFIRKKSRVEDPKIVLKKKKKRRIEDFDDLFDKPQVEFPKIFIRGAANSKCCFSGYMNTLQSVRSHLTTYFFDKIEATGFSHFLKEVDIIVNPFHLDDLVGHYIGDGRFAVKNKVLEFSSEDVGKILGIPSAGHPISIGKSDEINFRTTFWKKYFNVTQVTSSIVKDVFKETVVNKKEDEDYVDDCCCLWFCLLLSCFLCPTPRMIVPVKLFHYLERIENICNLNWADLIYTQLFNNMELASYSIKRRERTGEKVGEYIVGCVFVLNVFLWEHTPLFPSSSPQNHFVFQRYEGNLKKMDRTIVLLTNKQVSEKPLSYKDEKDGLYQPTLSEFIRHRPFWTCVPKFIISDEELYDEGDLELNDNKIDNLRKGKSIVTHSEYSDIIDISSSSEIMSDKRLYVSLGASCSNLPLGQTSKLYDTPTQFNLDCDTLADKKVKEKCIVSFGSLSIHGIQNIPGQSIDPPSFDLIGLDSFVTPKKINDITNESNYVYSENNLIINIKDNDSKYKEYLHDNRYRKMSYLMADGTTYNEMQLRRECGKKTMKEVFGKYVDKEFESMKIKLPSPQITSSEFWASAAASADEIEINLSLRKKLNVDDLDHVIRRIDFTPTEVQIPSMIKRVKERRAEEVRILMLW